MSLSCLLCVVFVALLTVAGVSPSAIPMWEYLPRGEKMSHLFNMFTKQVSEHCDTSTMPDCNKVLMVHGLTNLAKMEDESLDELDPYQRGAMDIIWDHMMEGADEHGHGQKEHDSHSHQTEPATSDNHLDAASSNVEQFAHPGSPQYVMGPMVVQVYPDGRPVPSAGPHHMPADEDKEEYMAMRSKPVPSMADLLSGKMTRSQSKI